MEVARPVEGQQWTGRDRADLLSQLTLFSHLDSASLRDLADRSIIENWEEGSRIVSQGDDGDRFYVILRGQATVTVDGRTVNEVRPGDQFGEIALLHGVPRSASVTATMAVETMSLSRADFTEAVRDRLALG